MHVGGDRVDGYLRADERFEVVDDLPALYPYCAKLEQVRSATAVGGPSGGPVSLFIQKGTTYVRFASTLPRISSCFHTIGQA